VQHLTVPRLDHPWARGFEPPDVFLECWHDAADNRSTDRKPLGSPKLGQVSFDLADGVATELDLDKKQFVPWGSEEEVDAS